MYPRKRLAPTTPIILTTCILKTLSMKIFVYSRFFTIHETLHPRKISLPMVSKLCTLIIATFHLWLDLGLSLICSYYSFQIFDPLFRL